MCRESKYLISRDITAVVEIQRAQPLGGEGGICALGGACSHRLYETGMGLARNYRVRDRHSLDFSFLQKGEKVEEEEYGIQGEPDGCLCALKE